MSLNPESSSASEIVMGKDIVTDDQKIRWLEDNLEDVAVAVRRSERAGENEVQKLKRIIIALRGILFPKLNDVRDDA